MLMRNARANLHYRIRPILVHPCNLHVTQHVVSRYSRTISRRALVRPCFCTSNSGLAQVSLHEALCPYLARYFGSIKIVVLVFEKDKALFPPLCSK